ncbi:hypothetical protein [Tolypothrix sp. VBCCA 56010]|uniref:hypothetical protein n=1 Tax=Tolypothrix sp. VBCCA 56010 TaxID=3137731 RepID=UPI003D7C476A
MGHGAWGRGAFKEQGGRGSRGRGITNAQCPLPIAPCPSGRLSLYKLTIRRGELDQ